MGYEARVVQETLQEYIPKYAEEIMGILEQFSRIDCGTGNLGGNAKVVDIIDGLLSRIKGIQIQHHFFPDYGYNIEAKVNPGNPNGTVILNGHLDTVFNQGDAAEHPFRVEGDKAYGLGIVDCKGGVVLSIFAVLALQEAGMLPDKELLFLFGCDEEVTSPVSEGFYREMAKGAEMALVYEPARDEDGILTSRKGYSKFRVVCHGKQAHAGTSYDQGASAVVELSDKLLKLYEANDDLAKVQFNAADLKDENGKSNVVSHLASAEVSVRVRNERDMEYVERVLESLTKDSVVPGCCTEIVRISRKPPMVATDGNRALFLRIAAVGKELGMELTEQTSGGFGDACLFSSMGIPSVDALGPHMYKIHCFEESMRVSSVGERLLLSCAFLASL